MFARAYGSNRCEGARCPFRFAATVPSQRADHLPCGLSFGWMRLKVRWRVLGRRPRWITTPAGRKDGDDGLIRVLAEFGSDAPEKRPGAEITVMIDAGSAPGVLFVGRSAFGRSNSEEALFRVESPSSIAHRVRVRYGRVVGNFAEIVDGLNEGDQVILSDMTGYEHARRIRFD